MGGGTKQCLYMTISSTFQLSFSTISQKDTQTAIKTHCKLFVLIFTCSFHELMVLGKSFLDAQ